MSSIALFFSKFANEDEIRQELSSALNLPVVSDDDIISDACNQNLSPRNKLEQSLYKKTSIFNGFTLERDRTVAHLKSVMAGRLAQKQNSLYSGFTSLLIPQDVTHVLKVLLVDTNEKRMERAVASGIHENEAAKLIKAADVSAYGWTDFVFNKEAYDKTLYDIVVPVGDQSAAEVVALIRKNFTKTSLLETEDSGQAVNDMALAAEVELALLSKGQKVGVSVRNNHVSLSVDKSAFSFSNLTSKLTNIASSVSGVDGVDVVKGKGYTTSVYRDQQFELPPKVLLVDDEREYVETLSERLVNRNVGSYAVFDGQQALDFIDGDEPDVMVLDLKMPGINGIEVLQQTKKSNPNIEVIILTGHGSEADRETCLNLGAFAYLQKPTDVEQLSATINDAYKKVAAA